MNLHKLLSEVFNEPEAGMNDSSSILGFAEWDSMTHMLFITRLEETYNVVLEGEEIASMQTIGDIKRILASKGK